MNYPYLDLDIEGFFSGQDISVDIIHEYLIDIIEENLWKPNVPSGYSDLLYEENWGKSYIVRYKNETYKFSIVDSGKGDDPGVNYPCCTPLELVKMYSSDEVSDIVFKALSECDSLGVHIMNACGIEEYAKEHFKRDVNSFLEENSLPIKE